MAYRETQAIRARKSAQRDALLQAAESLVREQGFAGLTVQALATRAGIAVGTVYRYFDTKDELACEVFRAATGREVAALAAAMQISGDVPERLAHACRTFAERALKAPRLAWSLIAEPVAAALDEERLRYRASYAALFTDLLAEGVASGELAMQQVELTASALVGGLAEALLGPLASRQKPERMVDELCRWCLRAAGTTGERA